MKNFMIVCLAALSFAAVGCKKKDGAGAAMSKMGEYKDKMCACKDSACAQKVSDEMTKWGQDQAKDNKEPPKMSEEETKKFTQIGEEMGKCMQNLRRYGRPVLCTEYMARPTGSRFDPVLGYLKQQHVAAYNWGFVDGKTQTIYPWNSWEKEYTSEPSPWFHDILRRDGTPYDAAEVAYIKLLTGAAQAR